MRSIFTLLMAIMVLASCAAPLNYRLARDDGSLASLPDGPVPALLEYRIATFVDGREGELPTICAGMGHDTKAEALPESEQLALMEHFAIVAPLDRCEWMGGSYRDAITGETAIVFDVHDLDCKIYDQCTAWAGYRQDAKVNGWSFFEARFRNGYWQIRPKDMGIILTAQTNK